MKNTFAPGIAAAALRAPTVRVATRTHGKVVRFFRRLPDAAVLDLVAALDKTLATAGMDPAALRRTLMTFAGGQP